MVVLPTGLGKTAIALIVAASRIYNKGGRVLVLAPTKPLVEQHLRFFERFLLLPDGTKGDPAPFVMFTGETPPEERKAGWAASRACFATPQAVKNDLLAGRYTLSDVSLLVVDECHRAVGNYAYVFIARRYMETARDPLILAMTASPGGDSEKVQEVCVNLSIAHVETTGRERRGREALCPRAGDTVHPRRPPEGACRGAPHPQPASSRPALPISSGSTSRCRSAQKLSIRALYRI